MDREAQQGSERDAQALETLPLDIDQLSGSTIYLILKHFIDTSDYRIKLMRENSDLSQENISAGIEIEQSLVEDAKKIMAEVAQILKELEEKPKTKIFTKPSW